MAGFRSRPAFLFVLCVGLLLVHNLVRFHSVIITSTTESNLVHAKTKNHQHYRFIDMIDGDDSSWSSPTSSAAKRDILRLVVLSDTHGHHESLPPLPKGDVLIHLGDATDRGSLSLLRSFVRWLHQQRSVFGDKIVLIGGNHDRNLRTTAATRIDLAHEYRDFIYLHDQAVEIAAGLRLYGASWETCERNDDAWATALRQQQQQQHPGDRIDILLTHIPPLVDPTDYAWNGSAGLTQALLDHGGIPLHLFGHVHKGRGVRQLSVESGTTLVNCATSTHPPQPVVIDWDLRARRPVQIQMTPNPPL